MVSFPLSLVMNASINSNGEYRLKSIVKFMNFASIPSLTMLSLGSIFIGLLKSDPKAVFFLFFPIIILFIVVLGSHSFLK